MLRTTILFCLFVVNLAAYAETESYNRVNFQVEVAREIPNDLISAGLSVEFQDKSPSHVASQVNTAINEGLSKSRPFATVKTTSGNQQTYPVYGKNNQVDAWRGRAELNLESRDFKATSELIMLLQQRMQVSSIQFSVAPDTRTLIENELVGEAIKAFQARATAISKAMGSNGYRMVNLSVNNSGNMPVPFARPMMRGAMVMESAIPAPEFSGGDSRLTVQANGTIELQ